MLEIHKIVFLHQRGDLKATTGLNSDISQHGVQRVQDFGKNVQVEKKKVAYLKKLSAVDEQYLKDIQKSGNYLAQTCEIHLVPLLFTEPSSERVSVERWLSRRPR